MESKEMLQYNDLTPAQPLDQKTLNKMAIRSMFLQASFNYERFQAAGWLYSILPGLEKIHTNKEDLAASMTHNMEFLNVMPFLPTFLMGIVLSMEQQKADINTIRSVRVATMGPLAGIGDSLIWFTLVPITAAITANMAINGSFLGPILFFVIMFTIQMVMRFGLMNWSYSIGEKAVTTLTKSGKEFTNSASILGIIIVGALTASFGGTSMKVVIENGDSPVDFQAILDNILPGFIPLVLTLMCFWLIKKKNFSAVKCIGLLLVLGIVGAVFGIWSGDYAPLVSWY